MRAVFDLETSGLLDHDSIDYTASPYKIKPSFSVWCGVIEDIDTGDVHKFVGEDEMRNGFMPMFRRLTTIIGHNILDFDLLVLKLCYGLDYKIADQCTIDGKPVEIIDTLVVSKTLNPDRYGGHSLDEWGKRMGLEKIDWRQRAIDLGLIEYGAPRGAEFGQYHPEMLAYNERDVRVNVKTYFALLEEMGNWPWQDALTLEHCVRDLVTRQSHRGFWFDKALADANVRDLDEKMEEIRQTVEPLLPPKLMGATKIKDFMPPKRQFKMNGEPHASLEKFVEKHGGKLEEKESGWTATIYGKEWKLPLEQGVPVQTHEPATVKDTKHIKGWLVELGWRPTQYKERDLTCDTKKQKLSREKFEETVKRYVAQTLGSPFCKDRCDELGVSPARLEEKLLKHDIKKPLKVYTNPTITVGMEKEIDPALLELADKFPHAKLVSQYLTYAHRRNSILGGGVDPDEVDEDDDFAGKGYMAVERIAHDHRIPTPADTCGAGTSRFKHRLCANIPRVTSLYGDRMRGLFGVDVEDGFIQLGYDFDSLEAKIEAHYVYKYEGGPEYGVSLTAEKPNDCHSLLAKSISELLGRPFPRGTAKNVKYGCLPADNTEILTRNGWVKHSDVGVGDFVMGYHAGTDEVVWTEVTDKQWYEGADVGLLGNKRWNVEVTEDHRWVAKTGILDKGMSLEYSFDLNTCSSILNSAPFAGGAGDTTPEDAAVVGWLLTDGYWKWSNAAPSSSNSFGAKPGVIASIGQDSSKFAMDVRECLGAANMTWKEYKAGTMTEFRINPTDFRNLCERAGITGIGKHDADWAKWVLSLSTTARAAFLNACYLADGRTTVDNALEVRQNPGRVSDAIALAMFLSGRKTTVRHGSEKCGTIRGSNTRWTGFQTGGFTPTRKTDVFCLTTKTGSFVIRQGGVLTITGNCSYGAMPPRVAKTIGCSLEDAKIVWDAFWVAASPLNELKNLMQKYWETTGQKKFLIGLDKRKLPIRSKSNVINTAFQSAGVICAKRAMVLHERKLEAEGLTVDFFRDDWKNKDFCQQLIAYHDEAQAEVRRSMVTWKKFKTEEECKAFKSDDGKAWSDPVHNDKGWFRGYCRAGELAVQSVVEAGRYYKLNVDLSAGYMLGRNWAECH